MHLGAVSVTAGAVRRLLQDEQIAALSRAQAEREQLTSALEALQAKVAAKNQQLSVLADLEAEVQVRVRV